MVENGTLTDSLFDDDFDIIGSSGRRSPILLVRCEQEDKLSSRCFECSGDVGTSTKTLNLTSPITKALRRNSFPSHEEKVGQSTVELFGKQWDKGSALHFRMNDLFKMAKSEISVLKATVKSNTVPLSTKYGRSNASKYFTSRKMCSDLFAFCEEYLSVAGSDPSFEWCLEELLEPLRSNLDWLMNQLGTISSLPESVYLYAANSNGNKCDRPTHHLFHLHLDVRWMHLNLLLQLHNVTINHRSLSPNIVDARVSKVDLTQKGHDLLTDLVDLAFLKFVKMPESCVRRPSPFTCSCVQELWLYLYGFYSSLHDDDGPETFWSGFTSYISKICGSENESELKNMYVQSSRSAKIVFSLWLLTNLSRLHKSAGLDLRSNHALLDNLLKALLSPEEVNDSDVKAILCYVEQICTELWEPRVEPIVVLWEYFYKKLNSPFYDPAASIDSIATLSKTAKGLLRLVKSFLLENSSLSSSSYHQFLRLVALHLKRTSGTPRHWNVIKGRVFSKMSGSKLGSLSQVGEHHVVLLFAMLACTVGVGQVESKFNDVLATVKRIKGSLSAELIQGQMALILLTINERKNAAQSVQILVEHINSISPLDNFDLLKRFTDEVQEIFETDDPLGLGLHLFVDSWMSSYLACCAPAESGRLIESLVAITNHLKLSSNLSSPDQETILFIERIWEHIQPCFQGVSSQMPVQLSDLAASLVVLFITTNDHSRAESLINLFVTKDCGDVWLSRRFLVRLIQNDNVSSLLQRYNKTIIKAWIKCCVLCSDTFSYEMKILTGYVENLEEISSVSNFGDGLGLSDAKEPLLTLCSAFRAKFESSDDIFQKQILREQLVSHLDGVDRWLKPNNLSQDHEVASNLYRTLGNILRLCPLLIYTKSKPNTVLQQIVDSFLLPHAVRNPEHKLPAVVVQVIKENLHLFIEGLHSLYSKQDSYIVRILRELFTLYIPRCVTLPSPLPTPRTGNFALVNAMSTYNCELRCLVFEMVTSQFLKKKTKVPHHHACYALKFLKDVLLLDDRNANVMECFIRSCFQQICDTVMFCDEKSAACSHAKDILKLLLNCDILREEPRLMDSMSNSLAALSNEHLAWSSRQIFDLLVFISNVAPDLVVRFLPLLLDTIKQVERKRGVGYDKNLRFGLERVESNLRSIKSSKET
ncbi:MMS22-like, DNA repair protein [Nesidiocoris tenuis]|uniref:Protein MMS22-like n=2 Tax=Nesidiocoris tenuis TaxID=355587 RepID=A0ABN7ALX4_9HEMI|nr:MMS22-like, DNA repair protein [Nesidiocoris tenuis]